MTDPEIDRTARAIADEFFRTQFNGPLKLMLTTTYGTSFCAWSRAEFERIVTKHLQRMLAERREESRLPTNEELAS